MPKYLWQVVYSPEGACGVIDEGGTARCDDIKHMVERVGGSVESCYFSLGTQDLYVIGDVPDEIAAASLSIHTCASGVARSEAIALVTPEQMDKATGVIAAEERELTTA